MVMVMGRRRHVWRVVGSNHPLLHRLETHTLLPSQEVRIHGVRRGAA